MKVKALGKFPKVDNFLCLAGVLKVDSIRIKFWKLGD